MLSEDDLNLSELTDDEIARAWSLWFDLAQATNGWDPPYSHGVFAGIAPATPPASAADLRSRAAVQLSTVRRRDKD
jgi:hypothetical protein